MKIEGRGVRCDSCSRFEEKNPFARDKRQHVDSRDRFFDFILPPNGSFKGIASESDPKKLAGLHCCPGCKDKVRAAIAAKDPELLPNGPLREILTIIRSKDRLGNMGVA